MKYCSKCGKELGDDERYCPDCGNDTQQNVVIQQTIVQSPQENQTNNIAVVGFVCSFFFWELGLLFGIIGLALSKKKKNGLGFSIAAILISLIKIIILVLYFQLIVNFIDEIIAYIEYIIYNVGY